MLITSNRLVAATCPECAARVKSKISIFDFSGKKSVSAHCTDAMCASPLWKMQTVKDKYRISVNCPACGEEHTYTLSAHSFWGKEYVCLNCPSWEIGIFHVGRDEKFIDRQLAILDDSIREMLGQASYMDDGAQVIYALVECIHLLAKTDNIKCGCKNPDITIKLDDDGVVLSCKVCGKKKTIAPTEENIDYLMQTGTIVLDDTILNF